jgi:4-aminobutyrate aminotransferase/(S)-3-amino-2-methylpropionate transaminase
MRRGVLLLRAGTYNNVIRVLTPLVITDPQLDEALDLVDASVLEVGAERAGAAAPPRGTAE